MRRVLKWGFLLTKRLYKKPSFLALLLLVPVLVFGYGMIAQEDSGMLTISVALEDPQDPAATAFAEALQKSSNLILFTLGDTPQEARQKVNYGKVDAAWILPANLEGHIRGYAEDRFDNGGFVKVIIREHSIAHRLTLEKLGAMLFHETARIIFADYIQGEYSSVSEEDVFRHFDAVDSDVSLFDYSDSGDGDLYENSQNYLLSPLRGLLGILAVVCGIVTAMYYTQDEKKGLYSWIPQKYLPAVEIGIQGISLGNLMVFIWLGLMSAGLTASFLQELAIVVLYIACCAGFCGMLRAWCRSMSALGLLLPVIVVIMLLVCPVFFDFAPLYSLSYLFPPTYFVNAAFRASDLWNMVVYTACCSGLYWLGKRIR